jgi:hypothetical protein
MTAEPVSMERRLALLLADGSGDFDFIELHSMGETLWLEGDVPTYALEEKAVQLAEKVGFSRIINRIRVIPARDETSRQKSSDEASS